MKKMRMRNVDRFGVKSIRDTFKSDPGEQVPILEEAKEIHLTEEYNKSETSEEVLESNIISY